MIISIRKCVDFIYLSDGDGGGCCDWCLLERAMFMHVSSYWLETETHQSTQSFRKEHSLCLSF